MPSTLKDLIPLLALMLLDVPPSSAQCTSLSRPHTSRGESIGLVHGPEVPREWVEEAIGYWRSCPDYGRDFPALEPERPGSRTLTIRYETGHGDRRCGSFDGSTITLYAVARDQANRPVSCGALPETLAHELGHALGLKDAPGRKSCASHVMAWLRADARRPRSVTPEECRAVGRKWLTPAEGID